MPLEIRVKVLEGRPLRRSRPGLDRVLNGCGEGLPLSLRDDLDSRQRPEIGPGLCADPVGLDAALSVSDTVDEPIERPEGFLPSPEISPVGLVRQPLEGALLTNRVELLLRHLRAAVPTKLVAHIGEELLRLLGERPRGLPEGVREDVAVFPIQEAQVAEGDLVAVKLMRCRALVHVLIVGARDLPPEDVLPSGDHLLRVDFFLLGGLVGLLDDRDLDLGLLGVELRLETPGQLHGLLHAARVVVLHRAPVDVQVAGVELGVDDAILAEGRPLVLPELPGVELDDEVAVDLLHLSHAAVPSFLCVGVTVPGEGRPGSCPCACGG